MKKDHQLFEYSLIPKRPLNSQVSDVHPRKGLLIKRSYQGPPFENEIQNDIATFMGTYFDFIYWPELGDTPNSYQKGIDAELKFLDEYLLPQLTNSSVSKNDSFRETKSNFVINHIHSQIGPQLEELKALGFETLKLKMTANYEEELKILLKFPLNHFEIRLDFNSSSQANVIEDSYSQLRKIPNLEYLEDPCPFDSTDWKLLNQKLPLAFDRPQAFLSDTKAFEEAMKFVKYFIIKPTRNISFNTLMCLIRDQKKVTLTNMMDSAVGTWRVYLYYHFLKNDFPKNFSIPGIYTHHLYENSFTTNYLPFYGSDWKPKALSLKELKEHLTTLSWKEL